VIAVIGPAGSGKSTLLNTLAGREVTETGPVRPTTTEPVAWVGSEVPTTLNGVRRRTEGILVDAWRPPPDGAVIVDCPPPQVVDEQGESIATQVLEVADAAVFVAAATRYADAGGFDQLDQAASRRLPTVMVVNRLPEDPVRQSAIAADFARKLAQRRIIERADAEIIATIPESPTIDGMLDRQLIARVAKDIEAMADPQSAPEIVDSVMRATLVRLRLDLTALRNEVIDSAVRRVDLLDTVRHRYRHHARELIGEVRGGRFATVDPDDVLDVIAIATARHCGQAARESAEAWFELAPELLDGHPGLFGHAADGVSAARDRLEYWAEELKSLPERVGHRGRLRSRRTVRAVRRWVFDPAFRPSRRHRRRIRRVPGLVSAARDELAVEIDGILVSDSQRFFERLGPAPPPGVLADLVVDGRTDTKAES